MILNFTPCWPSAYRPVKGGLAAPSERLSDLPFYGAGLAGVMDGAEDLGEEEAFGSPVL